MLLGLWLPSVLAYGTEIPPSAADRQKIRQEGFRESRRELEIGLAQSYNLQKPSLARKNSSFVEWIDLWRWCDLLSRDVASEERGLVQRHFLRRTGSSEIILCICCMRE
jgi:hypothetical protein